MLFKLLHEPFRFVCAMEIEENSTKQQDQRLIIFYICGFIEREVMRFLVTYMLMHGKTFRAEPKYLLSINDLTCLVLDFDPANQIAPIVVVFGVFN